MFLHPICSKGLRRVRSKGNNMDANELTVVKSPLIDSLILNMI